MSKHNCEYLEALKPLIFSINYNDGKIKKPGRTELHIHDECQIYVNLSGDVSFVVEDSVYPIMSGDIIITRPFEYHHCVSHSTKPHENFWISFSPEGNEDLFDMFFNRPLGEENHLVLPANEFDDFILHCHRMTNQADSKIEKYYNFIKLIDFLHKAKVNATQKENNTQDVNCATVYIKNNLSKQITVEDIAKHSFVSVSTLERHFKKKFGMSPYAYLQKKRLANSTKLLAEGHSVNAASEKSGFLNCSWFIVVFKKEYGITPFQYKRQLAENAVKKLSATEDKK